MKRFVLPFALLLVMLTGSPANAATINADASAKYGYTLVLGDSILYRDFEELHTLRPKWVLDGLGWRTPDPIPTLIKDWTRRKGKQPTQVVIALGTNYQSSTWDPWDYNKIRTWLPKARIIMVTPYRSTTAPNEYANWRTGRNATGMRNAAAKQNEVCVAEWREMVEADPTLVFDGSHPTDAAQWTWAELIVSSMDRCAANKWD